MAAAGIVASARRISSPPRAPALVRSHDSATWSCAGQRGAKNPDDGAGQHDDRVDHDRDQAAP